MANEINLTFKTAGGYFSCRVCAVITDGKRVLMAHNPLEPRDYYYAVGGRVQLGEELEPAVLREVKEETGLDCEVEKLAVIHENFFPHDDGNLYHEIAFFYLIRPTKEFLAIKDGQNTDHGADGEYMVWMDSERAKGKTLYPQFLLTTDFASLEAPLHVVTRQI